LKDPEIFVCLFRIVFTSTLNGLQFSFAKLLTKEALMFRRIRRAAFQANPINPIQMQSLARANQLVASGHPGQAGSLFASLANELENTAHPRRAANLHAQAAHAFADSQDEQTALDQARRALILFIQNKMGNRTPVLAISPGNLQIRG
jgi:hypothetical protein